MQVHINEHHRNRLCCSLESLEKRIKLEKNRTNVWKRVKKPKQRQRKMHIMLDGEMKRKPYDKSEEKITKGENSDKNKKLKKAVKIRVVEREKYIYFKK